MPEFPAKFRWLKCGASALAIGVVLGWSSRNNELWQVAHSVTPWVLLGALCSSGLTFRSAAWQTTFALFLAMLSFYTVRNIILGGYGFNKFEIMFWSVAAVAGGLFFGLVGWSLRSSPNWRAIGIAALLGLTAVDFYFQHNKEGSYSNSALWLDAVALVAILLYATYERVALSRVALAAAPLVMISYVLISLPDWVEKLAITGGI